MGPQAIRDTRVADIGTIARSTRSGLMAVSCDRMIRVGPTGTRSDRALGAYSVYSSPVEPVQLWTNGRCSAEGYMLFVPPFTEHRISCAAGVVTEIFLEAETVSPEGVAANWASLSQVELKRYVHKFQDVLEHCVDHPDVLATQSFDSLFFDRTVPRRGLDPRITAVVNRIRLTPEGPSFPVSGLAESVGLSRSRLSHFFTEQLDMTIRRFRAWKRARNAVPIAVKEESLLRLALEAGYADSSHFSHAIRSFFGVRANDLCRETRNLGVYVEMI